MRKLILLLALIGSGPVSAQGLSGEINSSLNAVLFGDLRGGISSGFSGSLGSEDVRPRQGPLMPGQTYDESNQDWTAIAELERKGIIVGACAPTQVELNHSGCRPIRELSVRAYTTYDASMEAMRPLGGLVLDGQTVDLGAGPSGPLD